MAQPNYLTLLNSLILGSLLGEGKSFSAGFRELLARLNQDLMAFSGKSEPHALQNPDAVYTITEALGLTVVPEKETVGEVCFAQSPNLRPEFRQTCTPLHLLDYLLATAHYQPAPGFHSPEIHLPEIPMPQSADQFWQLTALGAALRQLHTPMPPGPENPLPDFPILGDNMVRKIRFQENYEIIEDDCISLVNPVYPSGRVYINQTQFFQMVPLQAWEFRFTGRQPAYDWLKQRKGKTLNSSEILFFRQLVGRLFNLVELGKQINLVLNAGKPKIF